MYRVSSLLLLAVTAEARPRKPVEPPPSPEPVAELPVAARLEGPLFPAILPLDPGPVPEGLAHLGAQACAACHPNAWRSWSRGPHAGPPDDGLARAAMGLAGCDACHLPLVGQHERLETVIGGRIDQVERAPNPVFDPTSWLEGVTCAACHVREGKVLASTPEAALRPAPHPMAYTPELADGSACAACHELRMEGAAEPLYDTWGEWRRAGFEERGVRCVDCHGGGAADGGVPDHDVARSLDEALSVLLAAPALTVDRGGPPVEVVLTLVNTGAGHAVPSGSPWAGLRVRLSAEGPPDKKGVPTPGPEVTADLARTIGAEPPFATVADTRLAPGARLDLPLSLAIGADQPPGAWTLVARIHATLQGQPGELRLERRWPLRVR